MFNIDTIFFKAFRFTMVDFRELEAMTMESLMYLWWLLQGESEISLQAHVLNA